jgi:FAD/FMN-containing dehydrogenase/Fe-S oxidoreductase
MILDLSKYLNQVLEINPEEKWVRVQPGIARDNLNDILKEYNLHFAPDPATSSRANVGGMLGNNSSGTKSILYGKSVDHTLEIRALLTDGTILDLKNLSEAEYKDKTTQEGREGEIYQAVYTIVENNRQEIMDRFPKVMRRVGGYNLDELLAKESRNLSKLMVGSEGTLATILEAKLNLEPQPRHKGVCLVHYADLIETIRSVPEIVKFRPAAVEILDDTVVNMSRENLTTKRSTHVVQGDPKAVLIVEFYGDSLEEIETRSKQMVAHLQANGFGYAYPYYPEGPEYEDVWTIRKKGLGLMLGMKGKRKPIAFIEDAAIPLEVLPQYIEEVRAVCDKYETPAAMYAHASVGVIHVRPILDMRDPADIERFKNIAEDTFQLVKKYKGSWSGEHGDGLVRSPFNERFFGSQLYQAFIQIKQLFDPDNLMNPGKIVNAPPIDSSLRYGPAYQDQPIETVFKYRHDGSFHDAVHMCSGVGECRKTLTGTMCPSFMATMDEEHSTRGRANALRLAMSGQLPAGGLTSERVLETLDLCLSCKACKSECPSNVDMGKLKGEVLQKKYDERGTSLRDRFIRDSGKFARIFAGAAAPLVNTVQRSYPFRWTLEKMAGIAKDRTLPAYASQSFVKWYDKNYIPPKDSDGKVALFVDTFLNYHEPQLGVAAIHLLHLFGFQVELADVGCCQRPKLSNGFLHEAKIELTGSVPRLAAFADANTPVVVLEPSCATAWTEDMPDLIDDSELADQVSSNIFPIAAFLAQHLDRANGSPLQNQNALMHGHCHEKSIYGTGDVKSVLKKLGLSGIEEIDSTCCGMAGSFGYEKEHYALSEKLISRRLKGAVESAAPNTHIIADGFSCRHQIEHFTGRKAKHWVELFAKNTTEQ